MPVKLLSGAGPRPVDHELPDDRPTLIGRHSSCGLPLPGEAGVSRRHAIIQPSQEADGLVYFLSDLESRRGTVLNGVALKPRRRYEIQPGDLIEIRPWVLQVIDDEHMSRAVEVIDETPVHDTSIHLTVSDVPQRVDGEGVLTPKEMDVILQTTEEAYACASEADLADLVIERVGEMTGFANVALVKPPLGDGRVEVTASVGDIEREPGKARLSRALIQRAAEGELCVLQREAEKAVTSSSILGLGIEEAVCVAMHLGKKTHPIVGFLYADRRGVAREQEVAARSAEVVARLASVASMALSNIKRQDLERRVGTHEREQRSAAEAQKLLLPSKNGHFGALRYCALSQPGALLSGDFFDLYELPGGRLVVVVGDVMGKGMRAALLVTMVQGYLRGQGDALDHPELVAAGLSDFINERCGDGIFVTLWLGVLDTSPEATELAYVDAGHGYAFITTPGRRAYRLEAGGGLPLGVQRPAAYEVTRIDLPVGGGLVVVSDGLIEQKGHQASVSEQFGTRRMLDTLDGLATTACDEAEVVLAAVKEHAGYAKLADDATVLCVRREDPDDKAETRDAPG